jgi:hypothetical protein
MLRSLLNFRIRCCGKDGIKRYTEKKMGGKANRKKNAASFVPWREAAIGCLRISHPSIVDNPQGVGRMRCAVEGPETVRCYWFVTASRQSSVLRLMIALWVEGGLSDETILSSISV